MVQISGKQKVNNNLQVVSGVLLHGKSSISVNVWDPHITSIQDGQAYSCQPRFAFGTGKKYLWANKVNYIL